MSHHWGVHQNAMHNSDTNRLDALGSASFSALHYFQAIFNTETVPKIIVLICDWVNRLLSKTSRGVIFQRLLGEIAAASFSLERDKVAERTLLNKKKTNKKKTSLPLHCVYFTGSLHRLKGRILQSKLIQPFVQM